VRYTHFLKKVDHADELCHLNNIKLDVLSVSKAYLPNATKYSLF
jgi:hypothetical protein